MAGLRTLHERFENLEHKLNAIQSAVEKRIESGERLSNAVRDVAAETRVSRRALYEAALESRAASRRSASGGTPRTPRDP